LGGIPSARDPDRNSAFTEGMPPNASVLLESIWLRMVEGEVMGA
jgi:hypothetical protein